MLKYESLLLGSLGGRWAVLCCVEELAGSLQPDGPDIDTKNVSTTYTCKVPKHHQDEEF